MINTNAIGKGYAPVMIVLVVAVWVLAILSLVGAAYWILVRWRVHRDGRNRPSLREGLLISVPNWPSVSIIIPAHNEQQHAPDLLRSLLAQAYGASIEIIFVLDRCTDGSRAALELELANHGALDERRMRVRLIDNQECPEDWAGKCNAANRGAGLATGEILLFTDADTTFDPALVRASVALLRQRELSLLSALPAVSIRHGFEAIVQPVAVMQLMKLYPIARANDLVRPRPFANGQFMVFTREAYDAVGGHTAVKDYLLEDLAFANAMVHQLHRRAGVFVADDLLRVRMYESYRQFREGWRRIFIEAARRNPRRLVRYATECAVVGAGVAIIALLACAAGIVAWALGDHPLAIAGIATGCTALFFQQWTLRRIFELIGVPPIAALAYGYGSIAVARIQLRAARDLRAQKPVRWGGREYVIKPMQH